jgi:hypothetical protein
MRFLCLAYGDQRKMEALSKDEFTALVAECRVHDEELRKSGHLALVESLEWATVTVRARNGKVVASDGPYVETKEKIGGLFIIEAQDLAEATRVASMHPGARLGEHLGWAVEVRPIADACHQ